MIAIIDYDAGNLTSVARAVSHIGFDYKVTKKINEIETAERLIIPGVGAAGSAMDSLVRYDLAGVIQRAFESGKPILGICLGSQIIMEQSQENNTKCLGFIKGDVRVFPGDMPDPGQDDRVLKIPHMGWNRIQVNNNHILFSGIHEEDEFYFVHGFYPNPVTPDHIMARTDYGIRFASVVGTGNLVATQFHLEKSGRPGLRMLENFCTWNP